MKSVLTDDSAMEINDTGNDVSAIAEKFNDADNEWMLLALLLDKIFLFLVIVSVFGALIFCFVTFMLHVPSSGGET